MKTLILFVILAGSAFAQTFLPQPVEILPNAAHTVDGRLVIDDKTGTQKPNILSTTDVTPQGIIAGLLLRGATDAFAGHTGNITLAPGQNTGGGPQFGQVVIQQTPGSNVASLNIEDVTTSGGVQLFLSGTLYGNLGAFGLNSGAELLLLTNGGPGVVLGPDPTTLRTGNYGAGFAYSYTSIFATKVWWAIADNGTGGLLRLENGTGSGGLDGLGSGVLAQSLGTGGSVQIGIDTTTRIVVQVNSTNNLLAFQNASNQFASITTDSTNGAVELLVNAAITKQTTLVGGRAQSNVFGSAGMWWQFSDNGSFGTAKFGIGSNSGGLDGQGSYATFDNSVGGGVAGLRVGQDANNYTGISDRAFQIRQANVVTVTIAEVGGVGGVVSTSSDANAVTNSMNSVTGISSNLGFTANGNAGQSVTTTVRNSAGTGTCTIIFTFGIKTGGTC